jgi:hypothetical protein
LVKLLLYGIDDDRFCTRPRGEHIGVGARLTLEKLPENIGL